MDNLNIKYGFNMLKRNSIIHFLKKSDKEFPQSLSDRVNIENYAEKLINNANIVYVEDKENNIIGSVIFYCNDNKTYKGFVTYVYVDKDYRGMGIAKNLLKNAELVMLNNGMMSCTLNTHKGNNKAIKLYKSLGYNEIKNNTSEVKTFKKNLNNKGGVKICQK